MRTRFLSQCVVCLLTLAPLASHAVLQDEIQVYDD